MVKGKKIVCLCMAFALASGGVCGCTHKGTDDGDQGTKKPGIQQQGEEGGTDDADSIAEKYREKERQRKKEDDMFDWVAEVSGSGAEDGIYSAAETAQDDSSATGEMDNGIDPSSDFAYREPETYYDTREYDSMRENGFVSVADRPLSTFAADRDTASYSNVRAYIESGIIPPDGAVRLEEMINYFTYDYKKSPADGDKFSIYTEYADCPWNDDTKLMMVGINTEDIDFEDKKPSNLVFLIDTSGSMYDENKLPLVQQSFAMLAENLREDDRVSIVTYAGSDTVVLSGTPGSEQYTINEALSGLTAEGCTNGGDAIITAYELAEKNYIDGGNNRVILATDGDMNVGLTSESDLVDLITEEKESGIFLSVLGFGTDNLKDNKLEALADNGDGIYAFIDSAYEAKKVLVDEMGGTLQTVVKDVKFQIEFNPAHVKGYRQIGYENRALADADFANDSVDGGEIGAGHMVTVLYEVVPVDSSFEVPSADHKYVDTANAGDDAAEDKTETADSDQQRTAVAGESGYLDELATVNIRYKEPSENSSKLISEVVYEKDYTKNMSADMSLASAVALYGMLLKNSDHIGAGNYDLVSRLAEKAVENLDGTDGDSMKTETRQQFVDMVKATVKLER